MSRRAHIVSFTPRVPSFCPNCHAPFDGVTSLQGRVDPKPGAISVCAYCAVIMIFEDDLQLRRAFPYELEKMRIEEPESYKLVMIIHENAKKHPLPMPPERA